MQELRSSSLHGREHTDHEETKLAMEKRLSKLAAMSYNLDSSIFKLRRSQSNYVGADRTKRTKKRGKLRRTKTVGTPEDAKRVVSGMTKLETAVGDGNDLPSMRRPLVRSKSASPAAA